MREAYCAGRLQRVERMVKESWRPSRRRGEAWLTCEADKQDHLRVDANSGTSPIESPQVSLWTWRTQSIVQHHTCSPFITRSSASDHMLRELRCPTGLGVCAPSREYVTHALELVPITPQNVKIPPME